MINWAYRFLGNTVLQWVEATIAGVLVLLIVGLLKWLIRKSARPNAQLPQRGAGVLINAMLDHTPWIFILWLAIFAFLRFINLTGPANRAIETITIIVVIIQLGLWSVEIVEFLLMRRKISTPAEGGTRNGFVAAVILLAKIGVWTLVIILVLENIPGIHVTALLTSLGIGGIVIGLALQKVLGDLFASLTISIDQPFVEGDAISVDQFSGVVEHIGLKSTRLRSVTGEQLIFSNSDLLDSRIHNFKRMEHRLLTFTININYQTSHKKLEKLPKIIKEIIEAQPKVTFNRAHLKNIDFSALVYEVVYTVNTSDFNVYMDTQQKINLEILRQLDEEEIKLAYPTQTVLLEK